MSKEEKKSKLESICLSKMSKEAKNLLKAFAIKRTKEDIETSKLDASLLKIRGTTTDEGVNLSAKQVWETSWRDPLISNAENWELLADAIDKSPERIPPEKLAGVKNFTLRKSLSMPILKKKGSNADEFSSR